ncbi:major facilitator superfamily domain-containing protein [Macrophomina phaseolina]|uniref:Major facilitator superfamily domain-containing protein n=1 Tax=Macrophomina phaseolina TaxID=35725 RepID=A0ABQ8FW33_9PEZI|nr:major facilitator superfamily domain-containing protein [Macrophomina phaseolina]
MDQSATTQAYVSGMKEALSLNGNELVEFTTYFSIGYALGIVPAQIIQTMWRPSIFLPVCEIIWGALTLVTYKSKNAATVYAIRFFLGIFESTSWPGLVALIFNWYTPKELATRLAIFGVSGVVGNMFLGILQAALYKNLNGVSGLEGWQWLFIVSGCMTMFWGFLGLLTIPDSPAITRALWLTRHERELSRTRMAAHGTETAKMIDRKTLVVKLRKMAANPVCWLFILAYLPYAWSQRANSYFLLYLKGLTKPDGSPLYSTYKVNLIPLGGYGLSVVSSIGLNAISDWKNWRWQVSIFAVAIQAMSCAVLSAWPASTPVIMTFYFLTFSTAAWGYSLVAWLAEILRREPEARSVAVGLAVTLVYVGHATIPLRAWRTADSPRYPIGFPLATAFAVFSGLVILGMKCYVDRHQDLVQEGFSDETGDDSEEERGGMKGDGVVVEVAEQDGGKGAAGRQQGV